MKKHFLLSFPERTVYGNRYCYYCNTNQTDYIIDKYYKGAADRNFPLSMLVDFQKDSKFSVNLITYMISPAYALCFAII